jgi:DNA-binding MarR family transcriptional regulator
VSTREPKQRKSAERAWASMRAFVEDNSPKGALRDRLGLGMGGGRIKVLLKLTNGPMSLGEIAETHGVDAPYATIIVDKLESLGMVERTPCADDRRRKLVSLTPAGREAVKIANETFAAPPTALSKLSAAELDELNALLIRLLSDRTES